MNVREFDMAYTAITDNKPVNAVDIQTVLDDAKKLIEKERLSFGDPKYDLFPCFHFNLRLDALPVRLVDHLEEMRMVQTNFPRRKKNWSHKRWEKIQQYWRSVTSNYSRTYPPKIYNVPGIGVICNKAGLEVLKQQIEKQNKLINGDPKAKRPEGVVYGKLNK